MIDFTKSKQYTLSIRLSTDGFSFSIYNPIHDDSLSIIEKEIDTSLSLTANLKAVFHESDFLNHPYKRVNIMMASKRFTIAPLDLFEEGQAELLFYHNHQKRENETVLYNILRKNNVAVIFGIDKSAQTFLNEQYPEARFYSQSTPFIDYFSVKSRLGNSKKMYASVRKDGIDIYCFERGHLLLMDGGRGQVNIALGVLDKLGIRIPVCGMVKDDHHRTRGLYLDRKSTRLNSSHRT